MPLLNYENLCQAKRGLHLVNTSRGDVVDEYSILRLLDDGILSSYSADVLTGEFYPEFDLSSNPLFSAMSRGNNRIFLTPHIAGSTIDAWEKTQIRVVTRLVQSFQ